MAVAFKAQGTTAILGGTAGISLNVSVPATDVGDLIILSVTCAITPSPEGVAASGYADLGGGNGPREVWVLGRVQDVAQGSHTVTVTFSSRSYVQAFASVYTGAVLPTLPALVHLPPTSPTSTQVQWPPLPQAGVWHLFAGHYLRSTLGPYGVSGTISASTSVVYRGPHLSLGLSVVSSAGGGYPTATVDAAQVNPALALLIPEPPPPSGEFDIAFAFGPTEAEGASARNAGFATNFLFGPATAEGETPVVPPSLGEFGTYFTFGPATAEGLTPIWGGLFFTGYAFGPAEVEGAVAAEGSFATGFQFGPATFGSEPFCYLGTLTDATAIITARYAGQVLRLGTDDSTALFAGQQMLVYGTGNLYAGPGWWDELAIIPGAYADGYFDGNTVPSDPNVEAYEWAGGPDASVSRMLTRTVTFPPEYDQMQMQDMPWYDSRHPASERFYGAYITRVDHISDSTRERETMEGITSGGTAGRQRDAGASVRVRLWLTADGMDALEYGMTWLANALDGDRCSQHGDACRGADLGFFTACPPPREDFVLESDYQAAVTRLRRYMHGVSAVSGPLEVQTRKSTDGRHYGREVEFTLYAEIPWVWSETRRPDIALFPPVVIEDTVGNLILTPSAALPDGLVQTAINYSTNPSVEVNAADWSGAAAAVSGSSPTPYFTSGRVDGELAAAGTASYRCRILGDGSTSDSGRSELTAAHVIQLAAGPDGPRPSVSIWAAVLVSAGAGGSSVISLDARVEWLDVGGAVLGMEPLGSTTDPLNFGGMAFSGSSLTMPPLTTQVRVVSRAQVDWASSATPANNSDIRLYTDAVAVTVP